MLKPLPSDRSSAFSWKDFFASFMLLELLKGMALTGRYAFSDKITLQYPEEKTPLSRRSTRYDIDLNTCIFCGFCEESCPVDAIVETNILEYHGEKPTDLYLTKEMLLAIGDHYEKQIAVDRAADAKYR